MRIALPFVLLAAILLAVVWLDDPAPEADLVIVNRGDVFTLDPQRMTYLKDFRLAWALYEGLVRWNNDDYSIEPAAAAALPRISDDRRTYTFVLREQARWSNGDRLTADDFVFAFRRLLTPDTASYYTSLFFAVDGAREYFDWRESQLVQADVPLGSDRARAMWDEAIARFNRTVGVRAMDEATLEITLARPVPYFLDLLCLPAAMPLHRPSVDAASALDAATGRRVSSSDWCKTGRLVTNGPYRLDRWRFKRDMLLVRSETFHSPKIVRSASILIRAIDDPNTAVLAYETGAIDWLTDLSVEYLPEMIRQHPDVHVRPAFGTDFYQFNCRPTLPDGRANPFADAAVRRAFVMAIDRGAIVRHVTRLNEPVVRTFVPPGSIPGYESPDGLGHDPAEARRELEAAGWTRDDAGRAVNERGEAFPTVEILWTTNSSRYRWMSLELKAQWERELGVAVELRGVDTRFYREDLRRGNFMIARGTWYGDYGDPTTFLSLLHSEDGNNHRRYANPRVDALLDQAASEIDPDARLRLLEDVERIAFRDDVPMLVICQLTQAYMFDASRLRGLSAHPRLVQYLWQLERVADEEGPDDHHGGSARGEEREIDQTARDAEVCAEREPRSFTRMPPCSRRLGGSVGNSRARPGRPGEQILNARASRGEA